MRMFETEDGIRIRYEDHGTGTPLVFVPGYSGSAEIWNYQILHLADHYRCILLDPRGHGRSDKPVGDYSYDRMSRDLGQLLDHLKVRAPVVVGWSMGGGIAARYALDHSAVRALILVAPSLPRFTSTEDHPYGMDDSEFDEFVERERSFTPEFRFAQFASNFFRSEMRQSAAWLYRISLEMPPHAGVPYLKTLRDADFTAELSRFDRPVLICHSVHDRVCDPRWTTEVLAGLFPRCDVTMFEQSGHALMLEEPQRLSDEIDRFVLGLDSASP